MKQRYFSYSSNISYYRMMDCGIPLITLMGSKADYESITHVWISSTGWAQRLRPSQHSYDLSLGVIALRLMPLRQAMSLTWTSGAKDHEEFLGPTHLNGRLSAFCGILKRNGRGLEKTLLPSS